MRGSDGFVELAGVVPAVNIRFSSIASTPTRSVSNVSNTGNIGSELCVCPQAVVHLCKYQATYPIYSAAQAPEDYVPCATHCRLYCELLALETG